MTSYRSDLERLEDALDAADMAWWELEFPSGAIFFSENKTRMLGYSKKDFFHYSSFTDLLHPDDYDKTMGAMRDHMNGETDTYETKYRILAHDGTYKTFYDRGRIVARQHGEIKVAGIVINLSAYPQTAGSRTQKQSGQPS